MHRCVRASSPLSTGVPIICLPTLRYAVLQLIYSLHLGQATRSALRETSRQLDEMLHGSAHPTQLLRHFVTHEGAAGAGAEAEEAYRALLELERRSQGRVMSRPVSACTRVLAPLLLQEWQVGGGWAGAEAELGASDALDSVHEFSQADCPISSCQTPWQHVVHMQAQPPPQQLPEEYLLRCKRHLASVTLCALRHLHGRGRLMEGVLWQLNSYILNCLEKAGEAAAGEQQEELG